MKINWKRLKEVIKRYITIFLYIAFFGFCARSGVYLADLLFKNVGD